MAIVTFKIKDELMEKLEARNPAAPLQALTDILTRFIDVEPADRVLFVPLSARKKLEGVFGKPIDVNNVERFADAVVRTATLEIGKTSVRPNEGQTKAIEYEARAQGVTIPAFLEREIPELLRNRWGY